MHSRVLLACLFLVACSTGDEDVDAILALTGDQVAGEQVYLDNCATCHLDDGSGDVGPSLIDHVPHHDDSILVETILNGKGGMPAFDTLTDQEVADVLSYLRATFGDHD